MIPHGIHTFHHQHAEYTLFSGCIAYLYKYFTKGAASSAMRLENSNEHVLGGADEIAAFRKARVIGASMRMVIFMELRIIIIK